MSIDHRELAEWRRKEWLWVDQAACLVAGMIPRRPVDGFAELMHSAIIEAIRTREVRARRPDDGIKYTGFAEDLWEVHSGSLVDWLRRTNRPVGLLGDSGVEDLPEDELSPKSLGAWVRLVSIIAEMANIGPGNYKQADVIVAQAEQMGIKIGRKFVAAALEMADEFRKR